MKIESGKTVHEIPLRVRCGNWREDNGPVQIRPKVALIQPSIRSIVDRSYLRGLRAAEMAAWERSGGDYLLSHRATRIESPPCKVRG